LKVFSPTKLNAYFQTENSLGFLFTKIKELEEWHRRLAKYIDGNMIKSLQVAHCSGDKLVIIASNASIATQIHLQTADLLIKFKHDPYLKSIRRIECKVRLSMMSIIRKTATPRKIRTFSLETGEIIRKTAASIKDPKLKTIMEKIAGRAKF
jgi:hypothetical protein